MTITTDISLFALIANGAYNSITANATAITAISVGGNVSVSNTLSVANIQLGTTVARGRLHSNSNFTPSFGLNWAQTASFTSSGNNGGGVALIQDTTGYGMWLENSGQSLVFGGGNTSTNLTRTVVFAANGSVGMGDLASITGGAQLDVSRDSGGSRFRVTVSSTNTILTHVLSDGTTFTNSIHNAQSHIWQTSSTERVRIDSSGNVGIGTSAVGARLDIHTPGGTATTVRWLQSGITNYSWSIPASTDAFTLLYGSTERMRIDASGNVGIGTSSPGARLDVNGNISVRGGPSGEGGEILLFNPDTTTVGAVLDVSGADATRWFTTRNNTIHQIGQLGGTGGVVTFHTAGSERMRVTSTGSVGIGETSPSVRLEVNSGGTDEIARFGGSTVVNPYVSLFRQGTRMGYWYAPGGNYVEFAAEGRPLYLTTSAAHDTLFLTNSAERMRITSGGNVGIGTSAPNLRLDVTGSIRASQSITIGNGGGQYQNGSIYSDGNWGVIFRAAQSSPAIAEFLWANAGDVHRMRIDPSGNLGFNSGFGSVATAFGCRAWVNFNGTGTVAIRASGNVSSITDNDVGDYTINFTNAMPDTNYSVSGFAGRASTNALVMMNTYPVTSGGYATTSVRLYTIASNGFNSGSGIGGNNLDVTFNVVAIFR